MVAIILAHIVLFLVKNLNFLWLTSLFNFCLKRLKGESKYGKIIYPNKSYLLRTHDSFVTSGLNALNGIDLDMLGTNPLQNPACKGIYGPINISNVVKLPSAFPLEGMHAICLGIFKYYNYFFFSSENKDEVFYLGKRF